MLRIEPPESNPDAGLIVVALKLSPTIVVYGGTTIGRAVSSYTPPFTNITAGALIVGVPICPQAYLIVFHAVSIEAPRA